MEKSVEIDVAFTKGEFYKKHASFGSKTNQGGGKLSGDNLQNQNPIKCYICGKIGHMKKNCTVKFFKTNVFSEKELDEQS